MFQYQVWRMNKEGKQRRGKEGKRKRENMGEGKERRREEKKQERRKVRGEDKLENKNVFTNLSLDKGKDYKPFYQ